MLNLEATHNLFITQGFTLQAINPSQMQHKPGDKSVKSRLNASSNLFFMSICGVNNQGI